MLIEKDDINEMIKQVRHFNDHDFDSVMYLKQQINRPEDLHFTDSLYEKTLFRETTADPDQYGSIRTGALLEILEVVQKNVSSMPELPFTDKTSKIYDLTSAIEIHKKMEQANLIGQALGWGNTNPEVQQEKNSMKHGRH